MNATFYVAAVIAVFSTAMVIIQRNAIHALLYLVVSLLAVAVAFYTLGAYLVAALEAIIYAGAIMVLFVFVIMMMNLGPQAVGQENQWLNTRMWVGPLIMGGVLLGELIYAFVLGSTQITGAGGVAPKQVGLALYGPYLLGVELASMVLLAGLVGAYHLGRPGHRDIQRRESA